MMLEKECLNNVLSLNVIERNEERTEFKISVNGKILDQVDEVVYLGNMFSRDENVCGTAH